MSSRIRCLVRVVGTVSVLAGLFLGAGTLPVESAAPTLSRRDRFGVVFLREVPQGEAMVSQSLGDYAAVPLRVGWYSDGSYATNPTMPEDTSLAYVQLLRVGDSDWPPDWSSVQNAVTLNTSALWIVGQEPECPNGDALTPEIYAQRYRQVYTRLKGWDLSARIAIGAIAEPTPLRLLWLERTLAAHAQMYGEAMPIDVWNIHVQALPEGLDLGDGYDPTVGAGIPVGIDWKSEGVLPRRYVPSDSVDVELFKAMVRDFRVWMNDQGEAGKELMISGMGVSVPSSDLVTGDERTFVGDQRIEQFMVDAFDWLLTAADQESGRAQDDHHLVQRWAWFSLNGSFRGEDNPMGGNGSLCDYRTGRPTRFGHRFIAYQHEQEQTDRVSIPLIRR